MHAREPRNRPSSIHIIILPRRAFIFTLLLFLYFQWLTRALCCPHSKTIKYKDEWNPTTFKTFQSNRLLTLSLCQHATALNSTIQFNSVIFMCAIITEMLYTWVFASKRTTQHSCNWSRFPSVTFGQRQCFTLLMYSTY